MYSHAIEDRQKYEYASAQNETKANEGFGGRNLEGKVLKPDFDRILTSSYDALKISNDEKIAKLKENSSLELNRNPLSIEEKAKIKEETGWSDEIINCISDIEQYEKVYKNAGLQEAEIDGRKCLIKNIDMDYVDPKTGKTNRELMSNGRAPIDPKTGEKIELHHMGQKYDSPLVELCENSEHGDGNHTLLHPSGSDSWRHDINKLNQYNRVDRPNHWKTRALEG